MSILVDCQLCGGLGQVQVLGAEGQSVTTVCPACLERLLQAEVNALSAELAGFRQRAKGASDQELALLPLVAEALACRGGDMDGEQLERALVASGLLRVATYTGEPCGDACECALVSTPGEPCLRLTDRARRLISQLTPEPE